MSRKPQTKGECPFCGKKLTRVAMAKHLQTCSERENKFKESSGKSRRFFDILFTAKGAPEFWLIVQADESCELDDLDYYLRDTWFDWMDHLSAFTIFEEEYVHSYFEDTMMGYKNMKYKLKSVIDVGMQFEYEYDFGTTSRLICTVIGEHRYRVEDSYKISELVQNDLPEFYCENCKEELADALDPYGYSTGKVFWCKKCLREYKKEHEDFDEEYFYPVVNSPRMGLDGCCCGEYFDLDDEEEDDS